MTANANPPTRQYRNEIATFGPNLEQRGDRERHQDQHHRESEQRDGGPGIRRDAEGVNGLLGEEAAADDRHERDQDPQRTEDREQRRAEPVFANEAPGLLDVDRPVHRAHERADTAHRRPQGE